MLGLEIVTSVMKPPMNSVTGAFHLPCESVEYVTEGIEVKLIVMLALVTGLPSSSIIVPEQAWAEA